MPEVKTFLDTNIVIYAYDGSEEKTRDGSRRLS